MSKDGRVGPTGRGGLGQGPGQGRGRAPGFSPSVCPPPALPPARPLLPVVPAVRRLRVSVGMWQGVAVGRGVRKTN